MKKKILLFAVLLPACVSDEFLSDSATDWFEVREYKEAKTDDGIPYCRLPGESGGTKVVRARALPKTAPKPESPPRAAKKNKAVASAPKHAASASDVIYYLARPGDVVPWCPVGSDACYPIVK